MREWTSCLNAPLRHRAHHTVSTDVPPWKEVKGGGSQRLNRTPEANRFWRGVPVDSEQRCAQPPGQRAGRCTCTVAQTPVTSVELCPVLGRTQAACSLSRDPPRPPLTSVLGKRSPTQLQLSLEEAFRRADTSF